MRAVRRLLAHHRALALALGLLAVGATGGARDVALDDVLAYLGFDEGAKRDILAGQIVSRRIQHGPEETELALGVAALFPKTLQEAVAAVRRAEMFEVDPNVVAYHEITSWPPSLADFADLGFDASEAPDVEQLLAFDGGSTFNLSAAEIARFRALRGQHRDAGDPATREAVAAVYREVLLERYRAYREQGLAGIAPFDRGGGKKADPGRKLRLAASASDFFQKNEPRLHGAFLDFPKVDDPEVEHRFYWIKQRVQERPNLLLSHRMLVSRPSRVVVAERQYYVGHSYSSVQLVNAALPVEKGLVLFYVNRTSIDQLAGFKGKVGRPIAASRLAERVRQRLEILRTR